MVGFPVADLVDEICDAAATEGRAVLEELRETIGDRAQMCGLPGGIEGIAELIVAPSERRCGEASREAEFHMVAGIVEAAVHPIGRVAGAAPRHAGRIGDIGAAHVGVVEVERVLQQLGIIRCIGIRRLDGGCPGRDRQERAHHRSRAGDGRDPSTKRSVVHKQKTPFSIMIR